ncbi:putative disease resistance protein RGA3 [Trifolium repens]|nr:putative disease resistance protein RGA3 [Trifolium repens]
MAEAVLELVLHNLSSLIHKEIAIFLDFEQDLKSLASLLTTIKATLEDAEEKQFTNRAIKDWLLKLKDAAHILDDILDECATQALELEYGGFNCGPSHKVKSSCISSLNPNHVAFRYKISKKMKRIRERLDRLAEERSKFHLTEIVREKTSGVLDWRQTTSIITQPQVYGRDGDRDKIIDFLVGDASSFEDLSVYPIIGLGGLGKTTLVQLIFNHERVVNHFELRIWVCVSEDFSLKRMTKAIIESACGHACEDLDLDPLQRKLLNLLQRKRYLLVLDDVWDDEQENWQRLRSLLACGGKGASVLVTTRLPKVVETMGTMFAYYLSKLSHNDCLKLFKQRAFGPNEKECANLVVIGNDIVKKCMGVPLAAITLGNLLRFKREEKEWLYVKESKLWSLREDVCSITDDNDVPSTSDRIRHLSIYKRKSSVRLANVKSLKTCLKHVDQLSPHVMKCYSLRVLDLERRTRLSSSISCLKYLRYLNLSDGKFKTLPKSICKLWNLQILKLDNCYHLLNLPNSLTQLKALQSIYLTNCYSLSSLPPMIRKLTSLKTLTLYIVGKKKGFLLEELGQLNLKGDIYIRHLERVKSVMNAKEANMSSKNFKQLRLSWERDEESNLQENVEEILEVLQPQTQQLQTLGVQGYTGSYFPQWMSSPSLENLTFLQLMDCRSCLHLPLLGKLPTLKDLRILNMSHVIYVDEELCDGGVARGFTKLAVLVLVELPNLVRLSREDKENMFPCLSRLQITECPKLLGLPCLPYLNDLRIEGKCNQDLVSSIHKLSSLESLRFKDNEDLTCFPDGMLRNLTSLKILDIYGLFNLEDLPTELIYLNAIREIHITDCENLKSLTDEVLQELHSLKILEVVRCPKFDSESIRRRFR